VGDTQWLQRPQGRLAYDVEGEGPLVVCLPGMGELRSVYRFTGPALVAAGFRVATLDLRGHGDSDTTFTAYDDVAQADDALALIDALGGPALLIGNSMGGGAAVLAAADRPAAVRGLILIGAFVRRPKINPLLALTMRALMAGPWAAAAWQAYYRSLYPSARPDDYAEHEQAIMASLRRPAYLRAFRATTRTNKPVVEPRLADVDTPTLVVMGSKDRDFADPAAEAHWTAAQLSGELLIVPDAGHYPHVEYAAAVNPALVEFAQRLTGTARG